MPPHLRIARSVTQLARSAAMYCNGLGLQEIGAFADHDGFDGVMLGFAGDGAGWHLELAVCRAHPVRPAPTPEDLLVFYEPDAHAWESRCAALLAAGFAEVASFNPYWATQGRTFEDHDGYRVVIQRARWIGGPSKQAAAPA